MAQLGNLGSAFIDIRAKATNLFGDIRSFGLGALAEEVGNVGAAIQDFGRETAKGALLPLGVAVAANITQWQALEKQIQETVTLLGAGGLDTVSTRQFDELREGVEGLSREMGILESEIAPALYQSISAGIPRENVFSFLETAQKTAIGGATDVTSAVDLLTTAMNSFAAQGLEADEAADVLFRGVARGKTTIEELSASMARVAPVVAGAGIEFEEFVAIIATMTLSGTQTAEAMTNVRAALTGLTKPSEELNEIWREAGFVSSDAAIATLGLQGAMELVAEATGGSISEITRLVGGMEATNAILQVTGENTERFNSVLMDTSSAAGAANQAFELMQDTTGRAFGALTASLDRLGSAGGDLADDFAVPLVQGLTGAIDAFGEFTQSFTDFIRPVAEAWGSFISAITDSAAFRGLVTTIGVAVIAFNGLKLAIGGTLFALGGFIKLFTGFFTSTFVTVALGGLNRQVVALAGLIDSLGVRLSRLARFGPGLESALGRTADAARKFAGALSPGKLLGIGAAITAVAAAAIYAKGKYDEWADTIRVTSVGADQLADSLGLVTRAIGEIPTEELSFDVTFAEENADVITELRRLIAEGAAQEDLLQIGLRWVQLGNTPEEAFEALQRLIRLAGLPIELNFTSDDLGGGVQGLVDSIARELDLAQERGLIDLGGTFLNQRAVEQAKSDAATLATSIQESLFTAFDTGDFTDIFAIEEFLRDIDQQFGPGSAVSVAFASALRDTLNEDFGFNLDFSTYVDQQDAINNLIEGIRNDPAFVEAARKNGLAYADIFAAGAAEGDTPDAPGGPGPSPASLDPEATAQIRERLDAIESFPAKVAEVFANADAAVADFTAGVETTLTNSIPIFDVYTGAADIAFSEWLEGQNQLQADLALWTERTEDILGALPQDVAARIQQAPISQKAWLASLGDDELETAINELAESFGLVGPAAEAELAGLTEVVEGIRSEVIDTQMAELVSEMEAAGVDSATAWQQAFEQQADWSTKTRQEAEAAVRAATDYFAANPIVVPGISFGEISVPGYTTYNINSPTEQSVNGAIQQASALDRVRARSGG